MALADVFGEAVSPYLNAKRWFIAFSGGLDSSVLLHLAAAYASAHKAPEVYAIHVNHQLSVNALDWQRHCVAVTRALKIPLIIESVSLDPMGQGLEAAARRARYDAIARHLEPNDLLMTAHHGSDQAETLLYRLFRGTGLNGLAAMQTQTKVFGVELVRPLLTTAKASIEAYAEAEQLAYIDDESNADTRFDRNYIRHKIVPLVQARWPQAIASIARLTEHLRETQLLLDEFGAADLALVRTERGGISLAELAKLTDLRQKHVLRSWLTAYEINPSAAQFSQLIQQFIGARADTQARLQLGAYVLAAYKNQLYCERKTTLDVAPDWRGALLPLPYQISDSHRLSAYDCRGKGMKPLKDLRLVALTGGQRFKPSWRQHSTTVKQLWQECEIAPWHRSALPGIVCGCELVAIVGVGINSAFRADAETDGTALKIEIGNHFYLCE